ncbi:phosphatase PAP2 family protein [Apibacter raozihei]|uniref:phosphatase PAP2 family protein n=1 Tax=Apibacter TaxID=1778601 RepID=UPI000FE40F4A|nr:MULTISPECIES: phosphatase PAP2 family protein [Apibacter]
MNTFVRWDTELFLFLNNLGSSNFDQFWLFMTNEYYWIPVYLMIFIIVIEKFGWKKALLIGLSIGLMILITDNFASLIKHWIKRPRPCKNQEIDGLFRLVIDRCRGNYCFFSAHAANSFGLAVYLSSLFKKQHKYSTYLFFSWAALVSYSRIYVGVHFPLDIITGILVGILIGWLFSKSQKFIIKP